MFGPNAFGLPELLIVLVIVIVLFGVGRISKIAGELGSGIRSFKEGLQGPEEPQAEAKENPAETNQNPGEDDGKPPA